MATSTSQRVGIWIIAGIMVFGTLGAFFAPILTNNNASQDSEEQQNALAEYQKQLAEQEKTCPTPETMPTDTISPVPTPPEAPRSDDVTELQTVDATVGEGAEVKAGDCVELLFHGVIAKDGRAFEGGDNYAEGKPYRSVTTAFVPGFSEGLVGMKVGGERHILIPSDKAYGPSGNSQDIPGDTDLVFTVRITKIYSAQ